LSLGKYALKFVLYRTKGETMKSKLFAVTLLGLAVATTVALTGCKSEETTTNMETPEAANVEAPAATSTTEATTTTTETTAAPAEEGASTTTNTPEGAAPAEQGAEHQ
jgi:cytoskeletal protein RodZ